MSTARKRRAEINTSNKRASLKTASSTRRPVGLLGDVPSSYQQLADGVIDYIRKNLEIAEVMEKLGDMYDNASKAYYLAEEAIRVGALGKNERTPKTPPKPSVGGSRKKMPERSASLLEGLKRWASAFIGETGETRGSETVDMEELGVDDVKSKLELPISHLAVIDADVLRGRLRKWASSFIDEDVLDGRWPPRNDVERFAVNVLNNLEEIENRARRLYNRIQNEEWISHKDVEAIRELYSMVEQVTEEILDLVRFSIINYFEKHHPEVLPE